MAILILGNQKFKPSVDGTIAQPLTCELPLRLLCATYYIEKYLDGHTPGRSLFISWPFRTT
jgi:hypothetical protein